MTLFYHHKKNILDKEEIEFLINTFSIEKKDINFLLETKDLRERASYGIESFEQRQAKNLKIQVVDFINKTREILE